MKKNILLFFLITLSLSLTAKNQVIDSLANLLDSTDEITKKIILQCELSQKFTEIGEFETGGKLANEALIVSEEIDFKKGIALSYYTLGRLNQYIGDWNKALTCHYKAIPLFDSLAATENLAWTYLNMGITFHAQKNLEEAIKYDSIALGLFKTIELKQGEAYGYLNLSLAINDQGNPDSALVLMEKSKVICTEINDMRGVGYVLNCMAEIYENLGEYDKAIQGNLDCIAIREKENDKMDLSHCYAKLGNIYLLKKEYSTAKKNLEKAESLALEINARPVLRNIYFTFSQVDSAFGNYANAYSNFKKYNLYNNLLSSEEKQRKADEIQYNFEKIKKEQELQEIKREQEIDRILNVEEREQLIISVLALLLILGVAIAFTVSMYKRAKKLRKQRNIIVKQKERVDQQHKSITDSIVYAQKIQHALLTSEEYISKHLNKDFFIHYQPKDIVSGDFYWAHVQDDGFYLITADCTGHGVPGAFMSLLNISILNELVVERNITSPGKILDEQRTQIIKSLNANYSDDSKDGMDCTLVRFDLKSNNISFAGANNGLWIIRNGKLLKFRGDKMPVGKFVSELKPFNDQTITLEKGDAIYTFTDGIVDQFGGPNDKKFKHKKLENLLIETCHLPMDEQKFIVMRTIEEWMGDTEQTDDILFIGIKI